MKRDIEFPTVDKVGICAIPEPMDGTTNWKVHILNLREKPITNVLVATHGYGIINSEEIKTSQLRHFFDEIESNGERMIELIPEELRGLNNQYWVSFYEDERIFDKKFIFLPDTLVAQNLREIPLLHTNGILII
jgi:hypothetical protein